MARAGRPRLTGIARWVLGIRSVETQCEHRGFAVADPYIRERLEDIGGTFLLGYHAAGLENKDLQALESQLEAVDAEKRGFAYEGAAMALALTDGLTFWRKPRLDDFLTGPGNAHAYMVHVGVGWALARLYWPLARRVAAMDPLLRWLVFDGYGFHQGYFLGAGYVTRTPAPKRLQGYARRTFDQGLGRSLWFCFGGQVELIQRMIGEVDGHRQRDLWSGVGLAAAYAGGVGRLTLEDLQQAAGAFAPHLAQGAAFAAKARQRADNPAFCTALASQVLCGMSAEAAAQLTDQCLEGLAEAGTVPRYERWRLCLQARFALSGGGSQAFEVMA